MRRALFSLPILLASIAAEARDDLPELLHPDALSAVPKVCLVSVDGQLGIQNDFDPRSYGSPVLVDFMLRNEIFNPREAQMPRLVSAVNAADLGEEIEAQLALEISALGATSVERVESERASDAEKLLKRCLPEAGPFAVVQVRWSMRPDLDALQALTILRTFEDRRSFSREKPSAEVVFVVESKPIAVRGKTREDALAMIREERARFRASPEGGFVRAVAAEGGDAEPRRRRQAASYLESHRLELRNAAAIEWQRAQTLGAVADLWASGEVPNLQTAYSESSAETLELFEAWRDMAPLPRAELPEPTEREPYIRPRLSRFDGLNPERVSDADLGGQTMPPIAAFVEGSRVRQVFGDRHWVSSWNGNPVDYSFIWSTIRHDDWRKATQ